MKYFDQKKNNNNNNNNSNKKILKFGEFEMFFNLKKGLWYNLLMHINMSGNNILSKFFNKN